MCRSVSRLFDSLFLANLPFFSGIRSIYLKESHGPRAFLFLTHAVSAVCSEYDGASCRFPVLVIAGK